MLTVLECLEYEALEFSPESAISRNKNASSVPSFVHFCHDNNSSN